MRWQCSYANAQGIQCENEALYRVQFNSEHPFDHVDVCKIHLHEYPGKYIEDLHLKELHANRENS